VKLDGSIKLGDFGLGKVLTHLKEDEVKGYVGTPSYSSPEASTKLVQVGPKTDIFSLGILVYLLVDLKFPFIKPYDQNYYMLLRMIREVEPTLVTRDISQPFLNLISFMLMKDPEMRPSTKEILALELVQPYKGEMDE
jgi:serine/threonine protein kinase